MEISCLHGEISSVRSYTDRLERERKSLMKVLERGGYLHRRKKDRTDSTVGYALCVSSIVYALPCRRSTHKRPVYLSITLLLPT